MAMEERRFKSQVELFRYVWDNSDKKSAICGEDLNKYNGTSWFMNCFMHVLPKGRYTRYKYNPDNIMLATPVQHFLIDQGSRKQRKEYEEEHNCSFDVFFKKKEELLARYQEID